MLNKSNIVQILVVIFAVAILSQCNAQNKKNDSQTSRTFVGSEIKRPADEAEVEINIPDYEIKETNLEYLQTLPRPDFKFIFKSQDKLKSDLPEDVITILDSHWKAAIKFFYEDAFNKSKTAQEKINIDTAWSVYCQKTQQSFQEILIEAPNGSRKISQTEAEELYGDLNKAAVDVVKQVEKLK